MVGRFFGWIGPVAYLLSVACAVILGLGVLSSTPELLIYDGMATAGMSASSEPVLVNAYYEMGPSTPGYGGYGAADDVPLSLGLGALFAFVWLASLVWFACQAVVMHDDPLEDELWTSHMLSVAFVGRLALLLLNVALFYNALEYVLWFATGQAGLEALMVAAWIALTNVMLTLPISVYQLCGATRLANRDMLSVTGLVGHAVLSFFPVLGFIAAANLFVDGRSDLLERHDQRIRDDECHQIEAAVAKAVANIEAAQAKGEAAEPVEATENAKVEAPAESEAAEPVEGPSEQTKE